MIYFVNPAMGRRKGRKVKKRRTAAQRRATAKLVAFNKARRRKRNPPKKSTTRKKKSTTLKRSTPMAAKRKTGTRKSRSKGRSLVVTRLRRNTVYVPNRPKRRRRGYAGNPSMVRAAIQTGKDSAAVLVGSAAGRTIGNMLPSFGNPVADAAKGVLVAIGVRMIASRFLGSDVARFAAAGAMQTPLKDLITGFVPQAGAFLGSYDQPLLQSYSEIAGVMDYSGDETEVEVSSYSDAYGG